MLPRPWLAARWLALLALSSLAVACGGTTLPAPVRARALGFVEAREGETALWSRWGRVGDLRFLEVVVGTDEVDAALPLVLSLHGYADEPRLPGGPYVGRARPYRFVAPEGPVSLPLGHAWSSTRVRDERPDDLARDLGALLEPLSSLVAVLELARPTRGRPILLGYSQGGHLALALASQRPERFGDVIAMAAWVPPALEPSVAPRATVHLRGLHARDDERVPFAPTEALYGRLVALGWDATLSPIDGGHAPSPDVESFVARELDRALLAR